jgi:hypothetical protein
MTFAQMQNLCTVYKYMAVFSGKKVKKFCGRVNIFQGPD